MKKSHLKIVVLLLAAVGSASAADLPMLRVTVSDAASQVAYKGQTNAGGVFATRKLAPGEYVVQFNSTEVPKGNYALVVSAGKQKVVAESVSAEKFARGGVAMKVKVGSEMSLTGQVSTGIEATASAGSHPRVKTDNGKRYFWVASRVGSNLGGRWVEEGTSEALYVTQMSMESVTDLQQRDPKAPTLPAGR